MPTGPAERTGVLAGAGPLLALLALLLALTGCSAGSEPTTAPPDASPTAALTPGEPPGVGQGGVTVARPEAVTPALRRVLRARGAALRDRDRAAFARGLAQDEPAFLLDQATYFDNLRQLPIERLELRVLPRSLVRVGDDYWGVVEVSLQLAGFDRVPVTSRDRYRFSPRPRGKGLVVSSVTDPEWEEARDVRPQPWDSGPVVVRQRADVLGVFDASSVAAARPLMRSLQEGIGAVSATVPYEWDRSVVVYAFGDSDFLESLEPPPGADPARLDALTFTLQSSQDGPGTPRIALHPRLLAQPGPARDRLVRHELTHVALGQRADGVPLWLSEGIAEYVSVRPLPEEDRQVAREALREARQGRLDDLPRDAEFSGDDLEVNYAISWWACEFLATSFGVPGLWALLEELHAQEGDEEATAARLESLTGLNTRTLARKAAKLIVATYAPAEPERKPEPARSGRAAGA